ncbi:MAG: c-type cytochrome [Parvularculaceae bacterium]
MTRGGWFRLGAALVIVVLLTQILRWTADFVFREQYPDRLAIDIEGFEGPLVNRAELQRSWPEGLDDLNARAQLRAFMRDVSTFTPPAPLENATREAPEPEPDLATLLANADAASGERRAKICTACHTFNEGGRDGVGPNLWGVLGRDIAARPSFNYSDALANEPGNWTIEKVDAYLRSPDDAIPGNKMAFQGVRLARHRAEIIAYLRMQGADQIPLPTPPAVGGDRNP